MIGGLGGFVLPISYGVMNDMIGVWTSCFMLLFVLVGTALIWMHFTIKRMEARADDTRNLPEFPEMEGLHPPKKAAVPVANDVSSTLAQTGGGAMPNPAT
ncbi:MAG: hypothetical protein JKX88_05025, partial [Marinicaulis sp.]|nr:hypothetical protein [Marinicaulis sp.]